MATLSPSLPPSLAAMRTVLARITGRVQGVGFRYWTQAQASSLGLSGWVRNEPDGSVAALMSGDDGQVAVMVERLRRGPPGAVVTSLATEPAEADGATGFRILR